MLKKRELIELGGLIDTNLMFQNHHEMTRVKDLNQLYSRVNYFGFQFLVANVLMHKTFIS